MLKTSKCIQSTIYPKKSRVGVSDDGKAKRDSKYKLNDGKVDSSEVKNNEVGDDEVGKKDQKMSKFIKSSMFKKMVGFLNFFTLRTRLAVTKLRQAFVKALIFYHFYLKYHIQIEINALGYAISRVFN